MAPVHHKRPVFLNLLQIRLPVSGVVSILHRISGVLLFLCIPGSLWIFNASLASEHHFKQLVELLRHPLSIILITLVFWMLAHHLLAGIRHLMLDFDIGVEKHSSIKSSWLVIMAAPALAVILILRIYL